MRRTQRDRVADRLLSAGAVSTVDFLGPRVIDGGEPILRLPARVDELRQRGWTIRTERETNRTARYVLLSAPLAAAPAAVTADPPPAPIARLLEMPVRGPFDPFGDAA